MRYVLLLPFALLSLTACGSGEGSPCSTANATECASGTRLLVCEGGAWKGYACPSCGGGTCDWKGAANGDECPQIADTFGTCNLDGRVISCNWSQSVGAGVFLETACPACVAGKSLVELGQCGSGRCVCQ